MITVFGIHNCDSIKKTLNWLTEKNFEYNFHDYRKQGISDHLIEQLISEFSLDEIINRRGTTWRKLPDTVKQNLDSMSAIPLLQEYPALVKRPILTDGSHWLVGFDPETISQTLVS